MMKLVSINSIMFFFANEQAKEKRTCNAFMSKKSQTETETTY